MAVPRSVWIADELLGIGAPVRDNALDAMLVMLLEAGTADELHKVLRSERAALVRLCLARNVAPADTLANWVLADPAYDAADDGGMLVVEATAYARCLAWLTQIQDPERRVEFCAAPLEEASQHGRG